MANLKSLAKDTAIYGLSSIVGRFLNYLLVPLYTHYMPKDSGDYGVSTNIYAYTALILVLLTFGMETTLFRFANDSKYKPDTVFSTAMAVVGSLTAVFLLLIFGFIGPISGALGYTEHIAMNVIYFVVLGKTSVFYVFFINLLCTGLITFFFVPDMFRIQWKFDSQLLKVMFSYSWPILVLGIAGILNQVADKIIFPLVYPDEAQANVQLGIYGSCVKIAMIMAMITQAFRYAYEPIVFAKNKDADKTEYYATAMKYFIIFTLLAFLCVMGWMPVLKYIIGADYREGLGVVPIVMMAEIFMGIYFNLSFWYKLIDKTIYGAWFSLAGCIVLFAVNILLIPTYGYWACAWGGFAGYGTAMILSYIIGQKKNPIPYPLKSIALYFMTAMVAFALMEWGEIYLPSWGSFLFSNLMILGFIVMIIKKDLPLSRFKSKKC